MNENTIHDAIAALGGFSVAAIGAFFGYLGISRKEKTAEKTVVIDHSLTADSDTWMRMIALGEIHSNEIANLRTRLEDAEKRTRQIESEHEAETQRLFDRIRTLESTVEKMGLLLTEKERKIAEQYELITELQNGTWKPKTL